MRSSCENGEPKSQAIEFSNYSAYDVPIERVPNENYEGGFQRWLAAEAVQHVWRKATESLQKAIDQYYGRAVPAATK